MDAVDEGAEFAGVDEEGLLAAVAETAFGVGCFVFREEPEADGDLRAVEELAGEGDHVVLRFVRFAATQQDLRCGLRLGRCASRRAVAGRVGGHAGCLAGHCDDLPMEARHKSGGC